MSEKNEAFEEIEKHRAEIDAIDQKLVALLNERAGHSLDIRALKPDAHMGLYDPKREEEILRVLQRITRALCITKTLLRSTVESLRL